MPPRKPIGALTSAEMSTSGSVSMIGCQCAVQRTRTTSPKPIPANSSVIHAARTQPARKSRRHAGPLALPGECWTSWAVAVVVVKFDSPLLASLLGRFDKERHE
jgi:hypothetical protein